MKIWNFYLKEFIMHEYLKCNEIKTNIYFILWHINALPGNGSINTPRYAHATVGRMLYLVARQQPASQWTRWVAITWHRFSMLSAPFPVLGNRTVNTSTIIGVFYAWFVPKFCRGQRRSFANSRSWGTDTDTKPSRKRDESAVRCS
jgi:hypothetical protein